MENSISIKTVGQLRGYVRIPGVTVFKQSQLNGNPEHTVTLEVSKGGLTESLKAFTPDTEVSATFDGESVYL